MNSYFTYLVVIFFRFVKLISHTIGPSISNSSIKLLLYAKLDSCRYSSFNFFVLKLPIKVPPLPSIKVPPPHPPSIEIPPYPSNNVETLLSFLIVSFHMFKNGKSEYL